MKKKLYIKALLVGMILIFQIHHSYSNDIVVSMKSDTIGELSIVYIPGDDFIDRPNNIWNSHVITIRWEEELGENVIQNIENQSSFNFILDEASMVGNDGYIYQKITSPEYNVNFQLAKDDTVKVFTLNLFSESLCKGVFEVVFMGDVIDNTNGYPSVNNSLGEEFNGLGSSSSFEVQLQGICHEIPTIGQWGLFILSILILIIGVKAVQHRFAFK